MEVEAAIRSRRSIRKFSDRDVSEQVIVELLDTARWSPSWANTQPWSVFAVTGETLEQIKTAYRERAAAGVARQFEVSRPLPDWPPEMSARTRQLMATRAPATGPSDRGPGNLEFFAAPWLVLFAIDGRLQPEYACFDTGLLVQTFCLAAHERGLGSCIMAMAVGYPEDLHAILPAAEGKRFVVAVALGYPDLEAAINRFDRSRAELSEIVSFAG
jgi:nitroreductase